MDALLCAISYAILTGIKIYTGAKVGELLACRIPAGLNGADMAAATHQRGVAIAKMIVIATTAEMAQNYHAKLLLIDASAPPSVAPSGPIVTTERSAEEPPPKSTSSLQSPKRPNQPWHSVDGNEAVPFNKRKEGGNGLHPGELKSTPNMRDHNPGRLQNQ